MARTHFLETLKRLAGTKCFTRFFVLHFSEIAHNGCELRGHHFRLRAHLHVQPRPSAQFGAHRSQVLGAEGRFLLDTEHRQRCAFGGLCSSALGETFCLFPFSSHSGCNIKGCGRGQDEAQKLGLVCSCRWKTRINRICAFAETPQNHKKLKPTTQNQQKANCKPVLAEKRFGVVLPRRKATTKV